LPRDGADRRATEGVRNAGLHPESHPRAAVAFRRRYRPGASRRAAPGWNERAGDAGARLSRLHRRRGRRDHRQPARPPPAERRTAHAPPGTSAPRGAGGRRAPDRGGEGGRGPCAGRRRRALGSTLSSRGAMRSARGT
jgi:hypothetical protein